MVVCLKLTLENVHWPNEGVAVECNNHLKLGCCKNILVVAKLQKLVRLHQVLVHVFDTNFSYFFRATYLLFCKESTLI